MKKIIYVILFATSICNANTVCQNQPLNGAIEAATSPDGGALNLVLNAINSAKKNIRLAAYSLTSKPIGDALINKHKQGIDVMVVADKSQPKQRGSIIKTLVSAGIPVKINSVYTIQHSKILIVDDETVETGSFNYSANAAIKNSENVIVLWQNKCIANYYATYWQRLWDEGRAY